MKLKIRRNQAQQKGLFGGNKGVLFSIEFKVEFTPEEKALIDRYKLEPMRVTSYEPLEAKETRNVDIADLIRGFSATTAGLGTLQELESNVVTACQRLKTHLSVATTFGGEDTVEI